jgi:hypothetical protein
MKTIKRTNQKTKELEYKRVDDALAFNMTKFGEWNYSPKSEWKEHIRDFNKVEKNSSVEDGIYTTDKKNSTKHDKKNAKV